MHSQRSSGGDFSEGGEVGGTAYIPYRADYVFLSVGSGPTIGAPRRCKWNSTGLFSAGGVMTGHLFLAGGVAPIPGEVKAARFAAPRETRLRP